MKIYATPKIQSIQVYPAKTRNNNSISMEKPSFNGTPSALCLTSDYLKNYNFLKDGSYLDVHDDFFAKKNIKIRQNNLSFLDNLTESEKKQFIEEYKKLTGFPDLKEVSKRIENEFVQASLKSSSELNYSLGSDAYDVLELGYDKTCSVGQNSALPGSDLDRAYVILRGTGNRAKDSDIVAKYSAKLWENTDQRLLSYNHYDSFPIILTQNQVKEGFELYNSLSKKLSLDKKDLSYKLNKYDDDFQSSGEYLTKLSKNMALKDRQNVLNFGFFTEAYRDGKTLYQIISPSYDKFRKELEENDFYNYANITQTHAIKNSGNDLSKKYKTKREERKKLAEDFDNKSIQEQFEFIKSAIYASCELDSNNESYFKNSVDIQSKISPLLSEIVYSNKDFCYPPKIKEVLDGYQITFDRNNSLKANLYLGNMGKDESILWIDTTNPKIPDIVLSNLDFIKRIGKFNNVTKIQFIADNSAKFDNFRRLGYSNPENKDIFEWDSKR